LTARDSGGRQYPKRPVLGVGALLFAGDRVLLIQRGQEPLQGYWSLPGGGVETGERLEDAVIREVWEETGLQVSADSIATVFERIIPDEAGQCEYHYVLIDFYCTVVGGSLCAGSDSCAAQWVEIGAMSQLPMTEGTREVIEACRNRPPTHGQVTRP
jgi:8-oxo-dGTP diphosphatase